MCEEHILYFLLQLGMIGAEVLWKMDERMPKSRAFDELMQNDAQAAELFALLPGDAQSVVIQNAARLTDVHGMERMLYDYLDEEQR